MKLKCGHIDNQCGLPSAPPKKGKMIAGDLRKCLLPGWHSPGTRAGPPSLNAELRGVQSPRTWCLSDSLLQPLIAGGQRCNCQCTAARLPEQRRWLLQGLRHSVARRIVSHPGAGHLQSLLHTSQQGLPTSQNKRTNHLHKLWNLNHRFFFGLKL